jgi:hypothetical protein
VDASSQVIPVGECAGIGALNPTSRAAFAWIGEWLCPTYEDCWASAWHGARCRACGWDCSFGDGRRFNGLFVGAIGLCGLSLGRCGGAMSDLLACWASYQEGQKG